MRFNSFEFAFFLAALLALVPFFPRGRPRHLLLLVASWVFYGSWSWGFLLLLWLTTGLDWALGGLIARSEVVWRRRALLGASLASNIGILCYFKFGNFFLENIAFVSGVNAEPFYLHVVIPLGISFYTFQAMSYTIDVYRRTLAPCPSLVDFMLFVSFFPQLVAGPIVRAAEFLPQLRRTEPVREDEVVQGVELFLLGLFKKTVIADNVAIAADQVFNAPEGWSGFAILVATALFWIQIYCDFSAYSTMARGLGLFFGFQLPQNFDYPMLQTNPAEYRRAWHMTLGRWFTDYVYLPLGGSRVGDLRLVRNILITWGLTGLWHGASWHFVFWGLYNGLNLTVYALVMRHKRWSLPEFRGKKLLGWSGQVALLLPSAALFRAQDLDSFGQMARKVACLTSGQSLAPEWVAVIGLLTGVHVLCYFHYDENFLNRLRWPARLGIVSATASAIALLAATGRPFLYFQF